MKFAATLAAALMLTGPAFARDVDIADDKVLVLACLEQMEITTTWSQCLNLMFQPCIAEEVGSEGHQSCLSGLRQDWTSTVQTLQGVVMEAINGRAQIEVVDLMDQWTNYVSQKCDEVAASKPNGPESARLGCEITEIVGLSGEFAACLEGRSTADYCTFKE